MIEYGFVFGTSFHCKTIGVIIFPSSEFGSNSNSDSCSDSNSSGFVFGFGFEFRISLSYDPGSYLYSDWESDLDFHHKTI